VATPAKGKRPVTRIAYNRPEAAASLGMGVTSFETYVAPHIRSIRVGRMVLYPVRELERWAEESASFTFQAAR